MSAEERHIMILVFVLVLLHIVAARWQQKTNHVIEYISTCSRDVMEIEMKMERPFRGIIFAKDFSEQCQTKGYMDNSVTISLPTSSCGVRMKSNMHEGYMMYYVNIVIQTDSKLRQFSDQERIFKCKLPMTDNQISVPMQIFSTNRIGRMKTDFPKKANIQIWMELAAESTSTSDVVEVGQPTTISIRSLLPTRIGMRVVDCAALDGVGDISQKLLDERGCPIDTLIMPELKEEVQADSEAQGWSKPEVDDNAILERYFTATFPAFKFPDRDRIHLSCGVQLCKEKCQPINCKDDSSTANDFLERIEVFNSLSVTAPNIEIDKLREPKRLNVTTISQGDVLINQLRDKSGTLCLSPQKLALSFCILGLVFLIAIVVALCSLIRARSRRDNLLYTNSRSNFSIASSQSGLGSRLLRSDLTWPYGRVY